MASIRPKVKPKHTILFKFSFGLSLLFLVMIAATYMVVDLVAKDYLISKNKELIDLQNQMVVIEYFLDSSEEKTQKLNHLK